MGRSFDMVISIWNSILLIADWLIVLTAHAVLIVVGLPGKTKYFLLGLYYLVAIPSGILIFSSLRSGEYDTPILMLVTVCSMMLVIAFTVLFIVLSIRKKHADFTAILFPTLTLLLFTHFYFRNGLVGPRPIIEILFQNLYLLPLVIFYYRAKMVTETKARRYSIYFFLLFFPIVVVSYLVPDFYKLYNIYIGVYLTLGYVSSLYLVPHTKLEKIIN